MSDFTKKVRLQFDIDRSSIEGVQRELDELALNGLDISGFDSSVRSSFAGKSQTESERKKEREEDNLALKEIVSEAANFIGNAFISGSLMIASKLSGLKNVIIDEFDTMQQYSQLTDASIRGMRLTYGMSAAEAYATTKSLELLDVDSLEDLAMFGSEFQKSKFLEKFDEYSEEYNRLYSSDFFNQIQDTEMEMKEFVEDIAYEAMEFIVDNKDAISAMLEGVIWIAEAMITVVDWIESLTGGIFDKITDSYTTSMEQFGGYIDPMSGEWIETPEYLIRDTRDMLTADIPELDDAKSINNSSTLYNSEATRNSSMTTTNITVTNNVSGVTRDDAQIVANKINENNLDVLIASNALGGRR